MTNLIRNNKGVQMPTLTGLDHLVLTVADIGRTAHFYEKVLGMQVEVFRPSDGSIRTALKFGSQKINLHAADTTFDPKAGVVVAGSADLCFLSDTPIAVWADHFAAYNVEIEEGPVTRTGATGPIMSLYVRDPDKNLIEVAVRVAR